MTSESDLSQDASAPLTIRLARPSIVMLAGPAACGKSTFAARHFRPTQILSADQARALVCDDAWDQRFQAQAFGLVYFLVEQRLSINRLCVIDSPGLTWRVRTNLRALAAKYKAPCVAVLFDVPFGACVERDLARPRSVGEMVIERQCKLFERVRAGIHHEGFDQVFKMREQDLKRVKIEVLFRPPRRPQADSAPHSLPAQPAPSPISAKPSSGGLAGPGPLEPAPPQDPVPSKPVEPSSGSKPPDP